MGIPHVIIIPFPAQGHVIPAMELAQRLVEEGVKVTFVNTEVVHETMKKNWSVKDGLKNLLQLVSIPDGMEPGEDRSEFGKLRESMINTLPSKLEELIDTINKEDDSKLTCLVADLWMAYTLQVAKKKRIRTAIFCPASTATLATLMSIQKLIDDGFITNTGKPQSNEMIRLTENMPPIKPENLIWASVADSTSIEEHFQFNVTNTEDAKSAEWFMCNSAIELEPAAFSLFPQLLPIGPLLASNRLADQVGHFWQEDLTCIEWLDQQPACSVIYVSFGSFTMLNQTQFQELALGLELCNRPFLWVVRPMMTKESLAPYPDGYMDRVVSRGRIVNWAPQQKVLCHPSIACFMSHCGWNSTLEGVTNGLPFLCWPYFADQFYNETYISDIWKTGLGFDKNEEDIITRKEIKSKAEQLLNSTTFKSKALELKENIERSVNKGGCSHSNLAKFIKCMRGEDAKGIDQSDY